MSLKIDVNNVRHWDTKCYLEGSIELEPITKTIGFITLSIGIPKITSRNWEEFFSRVYALERAQGAWLKTGEGHDRFIKPEDIYERIGLSTNSVAKTKAAFARDLLSYLQDKATQILAENPPEPIG